MMQSIFKDLKYVSVYLDNILISSTNKEEHFKHLKEVFNRLRKNSLFTNIEKTNLFKKEINYLGHILIEDSIKTDLNKIEAISNWKTPTNYKEVQKILKVFGYYKRFIKDYTIYSVPLSKLSSKNAEFE